MRHSKTQMTDSIWSIKDPDDKQREIDRLCHLTNVLTQHICKQSVRTVALKEIDKEMSEFDRLYEEGNMKTSSIIWVYHQPHIWKMDTKDFPLRELDRMMSEFDREYLNSEMVSEEVGQRYDRKQRKMV